MVISTYSSDVAAGARRCAERRGSPGRGSVGVGLVLGAGLYRDRARRRDADDVGVDGLAGRRHAAADIGAARIVREGVEQRTGQHQRLFRGVIDIHPKLRCDIRKDLPLIGGICHIRGAHGREGGALILRKGQRIHRAALVGHSHRCAAIGRGICAGGGKRRCHQP